MVEVVDVAKALADGSRLRIIACLQRRELCVCQIIEFLGLSGSTVSKHLFVLRQAGLVKGRKSGRWMHYRLTTDRSSPIARGAILWALRSLERSGVLRRDLRRLEPILALDPEELCSRQRVGSGGSRGLQRR